MTGTEAEARRAIELNPSLPDGYNMLSLVAWIRGEIDEGTRLVETCYRLDPIRPLYVTYVGMVYFYFGKGERSTAALGETRQLAPAGTYRLMTEHALLKGDYDKAKELLSTVEKLQPTHPWVTWMKGFIAAQTGDREAALRVVGQLAESRGDVDRLNSAGYAYYGLGDMDSYFSYMNQALESRVTNPAYPMYCPLFAGARADPRCQKLIEKMRQMHWPERK